MAHYEVSNFLRGHFSMTLYDHASSGWNYAEADELARFERIFHRRPTNNELLRFRGNHAALLLRLPRRSRRRIASVIATL